MGATNHTTYYELSQFIGTDKPAWLQDYNGDMAKIDTGINAAKVAADDAATAASGAQGDANDALDAIATINGNLETIDTTLGTAVGNINTINSLIGNGTPTTSDQTIIGAINGLEGAIAPREDGAALANSYSIGEQFARGGSVYTALASLTADTPFASLDLNTDYKLSDSLVDQITNVESEIPDLSGKYALIELSHVISVNADGVKKVSELYEELATACLSYITSLANDAYAWFLGGSLYLGAGIPYAAGVYTNNASSVTVTFNYNEITAAGTNLNKYRSISTNPTYCLDREAKTISDGTYTFTEYSDVVPANGTTFTMALRVAKSL